MSSTSRVCPSDVYRILTRLTGVEFPHHRTMVGAKGGVLVAVEPRMFEDALVAGLTSLGYTVARTAHQATLGQVEVAIVSPGVRLGFAPAVRVVILPDRSSQVVVTTSGAGSRLVDIAGLEDVLAIVDAAARDVVTDV